MTDKLDTEKALISQEPERGDASVTREEGLAYRRECPYDAMGDYSFCFTEDKQEKESRGTEVPQQDVSLKQSK